jgi:AcrR family transcriptional regulator
MSRPPAPSLPTNDAAEAGRTTAEKSTAEKLCAAAMAEFNEWGFAGTDTNRIARRAGFAPQTFYRWYKDKTEIFVAAYRAWEDEERDVLQRLLARDAPTEALVEAGIDHHRRYLLFRRSLRQVALDSATVRRARAESRLRQIEQIRAWTNAPNAATEGLAVRLLQLERLADAVAEGELGDMDLTEDAARAEIGRIVESLRRRTTGSVVQSAETQGP